MNRFEKLMLTLALLMFSPLLHSKTLVLVHGYLGSAASWESSGVNATLETQGWHRAGVITPGPMGPVLHPVPGDQAPNRVYSVELPSLAPLPIQADHLNAMLALVAARHPGDDIVLAGHSAGGVAARLALVRAPNPQVTELITIASPHLGTERALEALEATDDFGPIGMIKDLFGGDLYHTVKHSRGVLADLAPAFPGSLLYWLNQQPHPQIAYYAIVRGGPVGMGDELIPAFSQDMNQIPALAGRADTRLVPASHALQPQDGLTLAGILAL